MYIVKNAVSNLTRNKGRNILIAIIFFAIITTTVVSLMIHNTSGAVIEDYRNRFGSEVSITPDIQQIIGGIGGIFGGMGRGSGGLSRGAAQIDPDLMLALAESDLLQKTIATATLPLNSFEIRAIDQSEDDDDMLANMNIGGMGNMDDVMSGMGGMMSGMMGNMMGGRMGGTGNMTDMMSGSIGNFRLIGDNWTDFGEGMRALYDGRFPERDGEAIVSWELADENGIALGDTILFNARLTRGTDGLNQAGWVDGDLINIGGIEYTILEPAEGRFILLRDTEITLTIVGIYDDITDEYGGGFITGLAALNRRNEVLTTIGTVLDLREHGETNVNLSVTYFLRNPDLLNDFEAFARASGLPSTFIVSTDTASYETIVAPVVGMKSISLTFMIIVLVLGAAIIILLTSIAVRERKYEIGVLRAMGMKKKKVAFGLWTELLVITAVCLVLGIAVGSVAAQPVADILIQRQVETAQPAAAATSSPMGGMFSGMFGGSGNLGGLGDMLGGRLGGMGGMLSQTQAQPLDEISINIGIETIGQIIGIALLLSTLAGFVAVSRITKYEPIKILAERN